MKRLLAIVTASLLGLVAGAQPPAPAPAPKAECPLCKAPNRAALLAGAARACPADCAMLCCKGREVTYLVEGLVCVDCSTKVTAALAKLDGVHVDAVCHNTGQARVKYDPEKVVPKTLVATIQAAGHEVTGQKVSFLSTGIEDNARAQALEKLLVREVGVLKVHASPGARGRVTIVFDPSRTTALKAEAALNAATRKTGARRR